MAERKIPTLNRVLLVGNLTKDPEVRRTTKNIPVVNFRIAASRCFKDGSGDWKEEVCYVGVVAWQKLAENCADYLKKGSAVFIEGELQSRAWETGSGSKVSVVEIHAHRVQFLDRRTANDNSLCEKNDSAELDKI
ncbi:MAG: single-stranded DNA-binding protein [bacterium]